MAKHFCAMIMFLMVATAAFAAAQEVPIDAASCDVADLPADWLDIVLPESDKGSEVAYVDSFPASEFIARLEEGEEWLARWEEARKANGTGCRIASSTSDAFSLADGTECRYNAFFCAPGSANATDDSDASDGGAADAPEPPSAAIPDFLLGRVDAPSCDASDLPAGSVEAYAAYAFQGAELPEGAVVANATYESDIGFCWEWRALEPDVVVSFFERHSNVFRLADGRTCCIEAVAYTTPEAPAPPPSAAPAWKQPTLALAALGFVLALL